MRTQQGEKAIGTLHVGDTVLAYNPKTHKMELEPILHVWINHDTDLVDLTLTTITPAHHGKPATKTSETIHTNQRHPFLTLEKGFLPVGQLKLGMHVLRADGTYGVVTVWKIVAGAKVMYNLEVAQDHTFTVGEGHWVVHNCEPGQWIPENTVMPDSSAARYQSQVTGQDPGWAYRVNDVRFDGYRDGTLLEAKGPGYQSLFERMGGKPFFQGARNIVAQAGRQLAVAGGTPIEWHVAEEAAADTIRNLLEDAGYGSIPVIWTPPNF